jgi:RHS repeat-associated protein
LTKTNTRASDNDITISSIGYTVNPIGQRTNATRSGAATNSTTWTYDALGQLVTADDSTNDFDRAYEYDGIGNRLTSTSPSGASPASAGYIPNALNQYTAVQNVNPSYDDDGNATAYPLPVNPAANATLAYDGENRLIKVVTATATIEYTYDALSRRIIKTIGTQRTYYVYNGWNCISEYTGTKHTSGSAPTLTRTQSYTWGLDLSQSLQGAGGVGGLLAITKIPVSSTPVTYYPLYDGNGNITAYIDETCNVEASFDYDPFGNITNNNNPLNFTYAFSTKPLEAETGLYYYGYRWYDSLAGRWINRDPIEENGGLNLYGFTINSGINNVDYLGQSISWRESNDCFEVTLSIKVVPPGEINAVDLTKELEEKYKKLGISDASLALIVNERIAKINKLRKDLTENLELLEKNLMSHVNSVYGGKVDCCIKFIINTSQSTDLKYLTESQFGMHVTNADKSDLDAEVSNIGGNSMTLGLGGLLDGKTFPHELGHWFGLRHPHYSETTNEDKKAINLTDSMFEEIMKNASKGSGYIPLAMRGYDHQNSLRSICPKNNIMGYGDGKSSNCDQIKAMIENIKKRSPNK